MYLLLTYYPIGMLYYTIRLIDVAKEEKDFQNLPFSLVITCIMMTTILWPAWICQDVFYYFRDFFFNDEDNNES